MQLAQFLKPQVDKAGGLLAMTDVYCLFNRARGIELVSPDDLLKAAQLFQRIAAPLQLKTFSSGVLVVQSDTHDIVQVWVLLLLLCRVGCMYSFWRLQHRIGGCST